MQLYRSFFMKLVAAMLVFLLAGCSAVRLGYSHGETLAYWWLDGYVDINDSQAPWVKQRIAHLFAWHRSTQLEDYAQWLMQLQQRLPNPVTPDEMAADAEAARKRALRILDQAMPDLADLALSLQPAQIAHLEKKFAANNEKYRKQYLRGDLEDRQLARYKQVMSQAEYWFGDFSREQQARIRAASDARPFDGEAMMAIRVRRQQELVALLRRIAAEKPERAMALRLLREHAAASQAHFGDARLQSAAKAYMDSTIALAASIVNMTTSQQKAFAQERLDKWIEDCRRMAVTS